MQPPIERETLDLLEWPRLCQHLSTFAATKLGAVAARHLQLPPTPAQTRQLLAQTQEACRLEQGLEGGWSFEGIVDIGGALERAARGGLLSGPELLDIATTLAGVRRLRRVVDSQEASPALQEILAGTRTYPDLEQEIHHCLEEGGRVADRASTRLAGIRSHLKELRDRIHQRLQSLIQRQGSALQEPVITQRGDRFVVPVKAAQKDQIPGIVHDTSSTAATLYVEPNATVEWGNQLRQSRRQEQLEEEAILRQLAERVASLQPDLERLLAAATALDLAAARARYSLWIEGNAPRFIDFAGGEPITLRQLRHPLLVWQQRHEQGPEVVPITVQVPANIRAVVMTGPNTGGKTVTLKTLGLAALMAKAGLFVPAREPVELPWFDAVLADIGDEQSLEQNLSTFSGHICRIVRILAALGEGKALVLLDEVGAGTDPSEGSALAAALLRFLAGRALLAVATTHYGELKALKYEDPRFENASVEFDGQTLSPTYRLLWGIPGRSNAFAIAGRLGLDPTIVEEARQQAGGCSAAIDQIIAGLEAQRREQDRKAQEASQLLQKAEQFYGEVAAKASSLQERERALKQVQEREVQAAIAAAKAEIAQVIRQLQQGSPTAREAQEATATLHRLAGTYLPKAEPPPSRYRPQVGERVKIPSWNQTGEVLDVSEESGAVTLRLGLMKVTVPFSDLESLDGKTVEAPVRAKPLPAPPQPPVTVRTSQNTADLRGKRVHEVDSRLERAIAQATASGVLWILHGKGTGKLREGVHAFLARHPQVERFELAPPQEGGAGVTIAYLL